MTEKRLDGDAYPTALSASCLLSTNRSRGFGWSKASPGSSSLWTDGAQFLFFYITAKADIFRGALMSDPCPPALRSRKKRGELAGEARPTVAKRIHASPDF